VDLRVRRDGSLIPVGSVAHNPRLLVSTLEIFAVRRVTLARKVFHVDTDTTVFTAGMFSGSLLTAGSTSASAVPESFRALDVKNWLATYAIKTVARSTGAAATGYHFGGAVKVVMPKTD
jgi:hypothetical protein